MTQSWGDKIDCPHCGRRITSQSEFSRWLSNNTRLDSIKHSLCAIDIDMMLHKFRTSKQGRKFQLMMEIEVKTFGAYPSEAQRDTSLMRLQFLRNRMSTPTKEEAFSKLGKPVKVLSVLSKEEILLRHFGIFLLRFSHAGPESSDWIEWCGSRYSGKFQRRRIDLHQLESLLRFDIDPDTFDDMEETLRLHHSNSFTRGGQATIESS